MATLYEKLGGEDAINAVVDSFYEKILGDPETASFFDGVDMEKQRGKQKNFITFVTGGPKNYTGKTMKDGHSHLAIANKDFDNVCTHLVNTLKEFNVGQAEIDQLAGALEGFRSDIVNK